MAKQHYHLECVGVGISIGAHITPEVRQAISQADQVFAAASDGLFEQWLQQIHPNVTSLQEYYRPGISRKTTYQDMTQAVLSSLSDGRVTCVAFYGHPSQFVTPTQSLIKRAEKAGFSARLLPGISAADCLYADLNIDPGRVGCTHLDASQFMYYQHVIDNTSYLVLWQPVMAGDRSLTKLSSTPELLNLLVEKLSRDYPLDHECLIYQAAANALESFTVEKCSLQTLSSANLSQKSTLIIPPSKKLKQDRAILGKLDQLKSIRSLE